MTLLVFLPHAAAALAAGAAVAGVLRLGGDPGAARWHHRLLLAAAGAATAAFVFLVSRFVVGDLQYEGVFLYTHLDLPLHYRVAGAWAGRDGSLLLWAACLAGVAAALSWLHRRTPPVDAAHARHRAWSLAFLSLFSLAFLAAAAWHSPFGPTPGFFLQGRPLGNGLNPSLLSPFMVIHPPVMFMAYALTTVPAAAGLAHLATGSGRWSATAMGPSRLGWLIYTFAMGLGGMWAYYTLGFGGYWAWDPVEVANFLPWLALSLYLHAQLHHRRHGAYQVAGPFLALLPFLLTILSTLSTRSGLWVSVHAFTDPTNTFNPDPPGRMLDIQLADPSLAFHTGLLLTTLLVGLLLWTRRLSIQLGVLDRTSRLVAAGLALLAAYAAIAPTSALSALFEAAHALAGGRTGVGLLAIGILVFLLAAAPALVRDEGTTPQEAAAARLRLRRLDPRVLAYASILILGLSLLVFFLFHMAATKGWSTGFYTSRLPFLATPALLALLVFQARPLGPRPALLLAGGALAAAVAAALLVPGHRAGAYLTVLAGTLVVVSFLRVLGALHPRGPKRRRVAAGALLLAALLNVAFWLNPPSTLLPGALALHPVWPVQLLAGAAAFGALGLSLRLLAGRPLGPPGLAFLAVGALGAYYVAPLLALLAWLLWRPAPAPAARAAARVRLHQAALHGIHFTVALAILGYGASTYLADSTEPVRLAPGEQVDVGGATLAHTATRTVPEAGTPWVAELRPGFNLVRGGSTAGQADGLLYWEPMTGSHYPLPTTLRLWDQDVYWSITGVCLDPDGACDRAGHWIRPYEATERVVEGRPVAQVELEALTLPGISLVWAALFLFVGSMGLRMAAEPRRPVRTG